MTKRFEPNERLTLRQVAEALGLAYITAREYRTKHPERLPPQDDAFGGRPIWYGQTVNDFLDYPPQRFSVEIKFDLSHEAAKRWGVKGLPKATQNRVSEALSNILKEHDLGDLIDSIE